MRDSTQSCEARAEPPGAQSARSCQAWLQLDPTAWNVRLGVEWPAVKISTAATADVICILLFAVVGRSSHGEASTVLGVAQTAWPFLVGCLVGVLAVRARPNPVALTSGLVVWACTVAGGVLLRLASGDTARPVFVLVAAVTLAMLLLGWRGGYTLVQQARATAVGRRDPARTKGPLPDRSGR
jgi:hypothetical protein